MTTSGDAGAPPRVERHVSLVEVCAVLALAGFGAFIRFHGFTGYDLWFDDAWAAMPARVGLSSAVHMVLTAPGFSLAMRSWIRLDPATTWWAQLPDYVLGVLAIPAVYAVVRFFRAPRWLALGAAVVIAVSPLAVQYATRVKEYPFDLLATCVLLVLAERVRRRPTSGRLGALAAVSIVAFLMSSGVAPILVGVWLSVLLTSSRDRAIRRALLGAFAASVVGALVVWGVFLEGLPHVLNVNWRRRGFLVDYRSFARVERSVSIIFGGFVHAVLAVPVPVTFFRGGTGPHDLPVAVLGAVVVLTVILVPVVASWRRREVDPAFGAAVALLCAVVLAAADQVPLGDGRTDEVLYPAFLLCLAACVMKVTPSVRRRVRGGAPARAAACALGIVLLAGGVLIGASHQAVYPTISLRGLWTKLKPLVQPGEAVFVDTFNSFGWCYYQITPCRIQVGGSPVWPQGFRPVAVVAVKPVAVNKEDAPPTVFIASHYGVPQPEFGRAQASLSRIWYVGYTLGTFDVGSNPKDYNAPVVTYLTGLLKDYGWVPARSSRSTVVYGVHTYAELFVRAPHHHR
jgi:hypothetical protein